MQLSHQKAASQTHGELMNEENYRSHKEEGKRVWKAITEQFAEGSGFLAAMLSSFREFLRKRFFSFLIFGIITALLAGAIWYLRPKIYQAEMTVSYVHYEKKIYADMLEKLNRLILSKSYETLAELVKLPEETVSQLTAVKGYNIKRELLTEDLSTERVPFYILVSVKDVSILDTLEKALVNYLDGTEFIQDRLAYMKQKSEAKLAFLEERLAVVDSLSRILVIRDDQMKNEKQVTRMELSEEAMTLFDEIQEVQGSLTFNKNIEILDGFVAGEKPAGKGLAYWVVYGFLIGLGIRMIILIFQ